MFTCQFAIGETADSPEVNFWVYKGVQCNNALNTKFVFDFLTEGFNSLEGAKNICTGGDIDKITLNEIVRAKNEYNLPTEKSTCVDSINDYYTSIDFAPPVFLWCVRLEKWLFFTKKKCDFSCDYSITAHDVESLASKATTAPLLTY